MLRERRRFRPNVDWPDDLKTAVEHEVRRVGKSQAEVIRQAIAQTGASTASAARPLRGRADTARADELLNSFGDR